MLFNIIEERVQQRLEAFQIEDRKLNQNWVTRFGDKSFCIFHGIFRNKLFI